MGLIILGVLYILVNRKEGFMSEMPFPSTMETAILAPSNGDYPLMPSGPCKPGVSDESYSREWIEYPYTPMASYAQITNNKEFWSNPNNGTSTPPDINGGLNTADALNDGCLNNSKLTFSFFTPPKKII